MSGSSLEGKCLCGKVSVELENPERHVEICQCEMCRRWSGGFYSAQRGEHASIQGEDSVVRFQSSDWGERAFCGTCGSHIWWRFLPTGSRSFSAGLFDAAIDHTIEREIFVDEGASWTTLAGDHPRQTGEEVIAEAKAAGYSFD